LATIIAFSNEKTPPRAADNRGGGSEVVVFPRTNIRVLRKMWGLPEYGLLVAGPDGRAIGAVAED
jgi:hypothetical protein